MITLLVLLTFLMTASASPMRVIFGGKTAATTPAPIRPSTAGKRIPSSHLHPLQGNDVHLPLIESNRHPATQAKMRSLAALSNPGESPLHSVSDSDKDTSYRPTTSESSQASQNSDWSKDDDLKASSKRQKTSRSPASKGNSVQPWTSVEAAAASYATTSKVSPLISLTLPKLAAGRSRTRDDSSEHEQRRRLLDLNSHRRRAGKATVPVELPPSHPTPKTRKERIEMAQRMLDRYTQGLEALREERNAEMRAYIKLPRAVREDPLVMEDYQRKLADHRLALERYQKEDRFALNRARVTVSREKKRQEEDRPLRGVGRPRVPNPTPKQLYMREAMRKWHERRAESQVTSPATHDQGHSSVQRSVGMEHANVGDESSKGAADLSQIR
jgi:hypothetical protein